MTCRRILFCLLLLWLSGPALFAADPPNVSIEQHLNEAVPLDLIFRNEQGESIALQQYFGTRPVVLVLAYYRCPRLCSLVLNNLAETLQKIDYQMGRDYSVVTVSFDPREKSDLAAAKKNAYVEQFGLPGADTGWHFLTGDEPAIRKLAQAVGFRYEYDPVQDQYAHSSGIMVLTPEGKIARYYYGLDYPPRDVRFGLEDAAAGKIGSPIAQPLRMLCFSYDATTGKYTLAALTLVRLGGALTALLLGVWIVRVWRHEKLRSLTPAA